MARVSMPVLGIAFFCDIMAFGLACGAVARRSRAAPYYSEPGYLTCGYTSDASTGLAATAFVFLLVGQVLITAVTSCFCCGKAHYNSGFGRICSIVLLVFSWYVTLETEVMCMQPLVVRQTLVLGYLHSSRHNANGWMMINQGPLKKLSMVIAEMFLLTGAVVNNFRTEGQVDVGVTTQDEVNCAQVKKFIFAVGASFTFLTMLLSLVYYFTQAGAQSKEQQRNSYRGEANGYCRQSDPYTSHDGPHVGMTAYN